MEEDKEGDQELIGQTIQQNGQRCNTVRQYEQPKIEADGELPYPPTL